MKELLFLSMLFCSFSLFSQDVCLMDSLPNPIDSSGFELFRFNEIDMLCSIGENNAPDTAYFDHTPVHEVRLIFHLFRSDDGTQGFQPNNSAHDAYLDSVIGLANWRLYNLSQPNPIPNNSSNEYIPNARIKLKLIRKLYHDDDQHFYGGHVLRPTHNQADNAYQQYVVNNIYLTQFEKERCLHVFVFENLTNQNGTEYVERGRACNFSCKNWTTVSNFYTFRFLGARDPYTAWNVNSQLLLHELGHNFGLYHTFQSNCAYTNVGQGTTNNIMDYSPSDGSSLTECQIGRIQGNIIHNTNGLLEIVDTSECESVVLPDIVITDDVTWVGSKLIRNNIVIKAGGTLTIECSAALPASGKIIVERGGKLVIDGGAITTICDDFWTGIEVHGHADQPHYSHYVTQIAQGTYPVDADDHGVVVIKNGGTIENAHVGITNVKKNNGAILTHSGGIIIAEEANFINCWKGVEMYQFRPDKAGIATNPKQNISRFTNCTFKTTSDYFHEDYPPTDFVTLWDVHDVQFAGCTFENEAYADFLVDDRGNGITSIDATYQLKGRCTAFDTDGQCTIYQRNSFSHLTEGISYTASLGQPFITWIDRTDFTGNVIGVQAKGTHHDFRVTRSHFTLPTSASVNNRRCAGVELLGSTGFTIEDNTFEQSATFSGSESSAGIRIGVSGQKANRIYRNTFTNITNGIWADDDNRGLQIKCNTFTTSTIHKHDVIVCGNSTRDGIAKLQGECRQLSSDFDYFSAPAGNLFSQSQGVQYSDWYNATALPTTKYHHHFTSTSNDPLELVYKNNATNEECVAEYDETKACPLNPILDDGKGPNQQISALRTRMADIHTELDGAPGGDYETYLNTEWELALSEGYKLYLTHDSLYGIDSARYWLEQDTSDLAKALLVALYVQEGDYTLADHALDSITDLAYTENTGKSYLDKLITIKSTDWHYGSTDSTTLSQVAALANDSTTYGWQAYGMLASAGYLEYPVPEPPCGPGAVIGSGKRAMDTLPEAPAANTFLTLQPNPTSGGVTLTWDTQGEQIDLRVLTPQGKVVYQAQSWPGSGTKHIATPWPAGMYFIVLTGDHGKQHSTSLLLTK